MGTNELAMDKVNSHHQADRFLKSLGLRVGVDVVRDVVTALIGNVPIYRLWNRGHCGNGTAYKIKRLYDDGTLDPFIAYIGLDELPEAEGDSNNYSDSPLPSGLANLDKLIGGMNRWDLLILGGLPTVGKSTLALNILISVAKAGVGVGLITLETQLDRYKVAMISSQAKTRLQRFNLNIPADVEDDIELENTTIDSALPIHTLSPREGNIEELRELARQLHEENSLGLLVVDSLQQITIGNLEERQTNQLHEIMRNLKAMARELDLPVLVVTSLNYSEPRDREFVALSVFPTDVANHADIVMLLHRNGMLDWEPERNAGVLDLLIAKNRRGHTGKLRVVFDERTLKFESVENYYDVF